MESIAAVDNSFKYDLTLSRFNVGTSYLNEQFLDALIEQLTQVCSNPKWHARRAAMEFVQSMIFSNLFNARIYAERLHKPVLKCLLDEQLEVRTAASTTLSGLYQCGYIRLTSEDMVGCIVSSC